MCCDISPDKRDGLICRISTEEEKARLGVGLLATSPEFKCQDMEAKRTPLQNKSMSLPEINGYGCGKHLYVHSNWPDVQRTCVHRGCCVRVCVGAGIVCVCVF